jgi:ABC-2 type transport system permease protein
MNFSRLTQLAGRVILQLLADRRSLALILVVPIILLTVVNILFGLEADNVRVGVVNTDTGVGQVSLGGALSTQLDSVDFFNTETLSESDGRAKLDDGELDALLILPPDLTANALQQGAVTLDVIYEGSNPNIAAQLAMQFDQAIAQALNRVLAAGPTADLTAASTATSAAPAVTLDATYLNGGSQFDNIDYLAPALIGMFVFMFVFMLTSISFLRERVAGTLERLKATPIRSLEVVTGYMLGFLLFGLLQGLVTLLFTVYVIDVHYIGALWTVFIVEALLVVTSVNLGIFMSTFAQNEFQVLQFIPLVVVSQVFLGGIFWAVEDMPGWLQPIALLMPLTHATEAMRDVMIEGAGLMDIGASLLALTGIAAAVLLLSARTAARVRV